MPTNNILVTGGAGFIGSYVNKLLSLAGYNTLVIDDLSRGNEKAIRSGRFIQGNIGDPQLLHSVFQNTPIKAVIHLAAFTDVGESVQNPEIYYQNNVSYTLSLLHAMNKYGIKTFIFSSSAAIFGLPHQPIITESHPTHPINPYGETKLMIEKILQDYSIAYGLKYSCLRYFNAAGGDPDGEIKNYKTKENNLIPLALRNLQSSTPITIFGTDYPTPDGTCIRDYVHVHDLGQAHILAMQRLFAGEPSDSYNLGNGQGFSVRQVLDAVEKATGRPLNKIEGSRRPGDPPILVADATKARQKLGWTPLYSSLEVMVEHAWKALNNREMKE